MLTNKRRLNGRYTRNRCAIGLTGSLLSVATSEATKASKGMKGISIRIESKDYRARGMVVSRTKRLARDLARVLGEHSNESLRRIVFQQGVEVEGLSTADQ